MRTKITDLLKRTLAAGLLGLGLRLLLYRVGFDEKGILSATHPLHLICITLTAFMTVYLALESRKRCKRSRFSAGHLPLAAGIVCGLLLLWHSLTLPKGGAAMLGVFRMVLGVAAAPAAALSLHAPLRGSRTRLLSHCVLCVYFALDMLCRYQSWSGNPQLPDYCFHILACVFLALSAYHRLALDAGIGKPKLHRFCALMALYLCLLSAAGPEGRAFYLGGAFWAGAGVETPKPPEPRSEPAPKEG